MGYICIYNQCAKIVYDLKGRYIGRTTTYPVIWISTRMGAYRTRTVYVHTVYTRTLVGVGRSSLQFYRGNNTIKFHSSRICFAFKVVVIQTGVCPFIGERCYQLCAYVSACYCHSLTCCGFAQPVVVMLNDLPEPSSNSIEVILTLCFIFINCLAISRCTCCICFTMFRFILFIYR